MAGGRRRCRQSLDPARRGRVDLAGAAPRVRLRATSDLDAGAGWRLADPGALAGVAAVAGAGCRDRQHGDSRGGGTLSLAGRTCRAGAVVVPQAGHSCSGRDGGDRRRRDFRCGSRERLLVARCPVANRRDVAMGSRLRRDPGPPGCRPDWGAVAVPAHRGGDRRALAAAGPAPRDGSRRDVASRLPPQPARNHADGLGHREARSAHAGGRRRMAGRATAHRPPPRARACQPSRLPDASHCPGSLRRLLVPPAGVDGGAAGPCRA